MDLNAQRGRFLCGIIGWVNGPVPMAHDKGTGTSTHMGNYPHNKDK